MEAIGILGGTFDPVHCGHLRLALEMREQLGLANVRLLPAPNPRLRAAPAADARARVRMLEAAIDGVPGLALDTRELAREGPTYTVDTLESLRAELPEAALCLILGMDAFARIDRWGDWRRIGELAHIAVAHRPGAFPPATGPVAEFLAEHGADDPRALYAQPAGLVFLREISALDISATRIRDLRARGAGVRGLMPERVHAIVTEEEIYAQVE